MCNDCLENIVLNEKWDFEHEDNLEIVEWREGGEFICSLFLHF